METTYTRTSDRAGFLTFLWSVFLTTGLAALVMWLSGGYDGYALTRPAYLMPAAAVYTIDIAARLIFGLSLFLTLRSTPREGASPTARTTAIVLWSIAYVMSLAFPLALFTIDLHMFSFIWLLVMIGVTTAQFIVNFKVSIAAAVTVLPYWGLLIYGACVLFGVM